MGKKTQRVEVLIPYKMILNRNLPIDSKHGAVKGREIEVIAEWREEEALSSYGPGRLVKYEFVGDQNEMVCAFPHEVDEVDEVDDG